MGLYPDCSMCDSKCPDDVGDVMHLIFETSAIVTLQSIKCKIPLDALDQKIIFVLSSLSVLVVLFCMYGCRFIASI